MTDDRILSKGAIDGDWHEVPVRFERHPASPGLADFVRHYWITSWRIPDGEHLDRQVLAYPACNLVVEPASAVLAGPTGGLSVQRLEGSSWAFGVLLRPAAGFRLAGVSLARLVDSVLDIGAIARADELCASVRTALVDDPAADDSQRAAIDAFESWFRGLDIEPDAEDRLVNEIARAVEEDSALIRVTELARRFGLERRRLERLLAKRIGRSPKQLVQRRRLQEAAYAINTGDGGDLSALAQRLGYADYSHFSREFAAVTGRTPAEFRP